MNDAPLLAIDGLRFRWPGAASDQIDLPDFALHPGERVFLHGPSGSGKSTLLGLIGGVLQPQAGRIVLGDTEMSSLRAAARDRLRVDRIGFVFQQFNLIPYLGVLDNVLLPCRFSASRRMRAQPSPADEARRLVRALDLDDELLDRPVTQLSVGQQQRVAAARALIGRPSLVIADEPTSALDADRQQRFLDLLLGQCAQTQAGLLFVSHDERLAGAFDRRVSLTAVNRAGRPADAATKAPS